MTPSGKRIGRPPTARKVLWVTLSDLLDDGTGHVHPALAGLFANLTAMPIPGRA